MFDVACTKAGCEQHTLELHHRLYQAVHEVSILAHMREQPQKDPTTAHQYAGCQPLCICYQLLLNRHRVLIISLLHAPAQKAVRGGGHAGEGVTTTHCLETRAQATGRTVV